MFGDRKRTSCCPNAGFISISFIHSQRVIFKDFDFTLVGQLFCKVRRQWSRRSLSFFVRRLIHDHYFSLSFLSLLPLVHLVLLLLQQVEERREYGICKYHFMKWPGAHFHYTGKLFFWSFTPWPSCVGTIIFSLVPQVYLARCRGELGMVLKGPEFLEGLPPSPVSRSPRPCFIHSLGLTAGLSCPFHSFLNRSDFTFPSDMENAFGIYGRKEVDSIVLQMIKTKLIYNLLRPGHIFPYSASTG